MTLESASADLEANVEPLAITPGGMTVGWWVELPVGDHDEPVWVQIGALLPPERTLEQRWAIRVRRGRDHWWVRMAPRLAFPVCDVDPH